jgi:hypothetical protein
MFVTDPRCALWALGSALTHAGGRRRGGALLAGLLLSCSGGPAKRGDSAGAEDGAHDDAHGDGGHEGAADGGHDGAADGGHDSGESGHPYGTLAVTVRLDGAPAADVLLTQPGAERTWRTDAEGRALVELDLTVFGAVALMASHPAARIGGDELYDSMIEAGTYEIDLVRVVGGDNLLYEFQDPGTPERYDSTAQCAHCHAKLTADWYASPHNSSAQNPLVHDLYAGTAAALDEEGRCVSAGGRWWVGIGPGTGAPAARCYIGDGLLPAYNADCGVDSPCDGVATRTGGCADCHAPGIDGRLGGRDLLEATGHAYAHGVHCDVCHKVEAVNLEAAQPGVGGQLVIQRPVEPSTSPALGEWMPLTFGPYADVRNPRMGAVGRELFTGAELCAACHEHWPAEHAVGVRVDADRWPEGRLPVLTTYSELLEGPLGPDSVAGRPGVVCQDCHMPPDPTQGNSADLGTGGHSGTDEHVELDPIDVGIATGWLRPPGAVRRHVWFGPRSAEQSLLPLSASLDLAARVEASAEGDLLHVDVTVHNVGPAHALPTGEPMRQLVLLVEARCGGAPLAQVGGAVVPDLGGALEVRGADVAWARWPAAQVGERLRVIDVLDEYYDYDGPLSFAAGRWPADQKGMPVERLVGEVEVLAVGPLGALTLSAPLPEGDRVYRVAAAPGLPGDGAPLGTWAGAPGFGFGKVMVAPDGRRNVPHFVASDVVSDNRIPAGGRAEVGVDFALPCANPEVEAVLQYRRAPVELAAERGWDLREQRVTAARVAL